VLEVVKGMYPQAPVFTSIYWPEALPPEYSDWDVRASSLNRLPLIHQHHQWFLPLYPLAFEQLDLSDYDVVISVTSAFAHGVVTPSSTLHVSYCLTPARFLWDYSTYVAQERLGRLVRLAMPFLLYNLRQWDRLAADRVDHFVTLSHAVQQRIQKTYRRSADVIYPPVEVQRFQVSEVRGDYYLMINRLIPYKRIDLAIKAFNQLGLPLWIIGEGRARPALQAIAGPNIRFLGRLTDAEVEQCLANCRALVFPGREDFGIAPLEAQAVGRPVVAYAAGGAVETVVDGVSGVLFEQQTTGSLADAVTRLEALRLDPHTIRKNAERFDRQEFVAAFDDLVRTRYAEFSAQRML